MASLRKRYADRIEVSPRQDELPVTTASTEAAKLPEPVTELPPPEMPETKESPADVAAKNALRERLREMENAEALTRQAQQQPQHATEPRQEPQEPTFEECIAHLPERARGWYRRDPKLLSDPERAAQVQYVHHVVCRELGGEGTEDAYFNRMEAMLFPSTTNGQARPTESTPPAAPAPRHEAPPRRAMSAPVSAPPSREPVSMRTGRPQSFRAPLTADEVEIARASGISPERYAQEKEKMLRLRAAGQLDDR